MPQWHSSAGPIQTKRVYKLLSSLRSLANTKYSKRGVIGGSEHTVSIISIGLGRQQAESPESIAILGLLAEVGDQFAYSLTRENLTAVEAALKVAIKKAEKLVPVDDQRVTPAEQAANIREQARQRDTGAAKAATEEQARQRAWAPILAKVGKADALIIATLKEDTSEPQSDYSGNKAVRRVAIGVRFGAREDFAQIKTAAERFLTSIGEAGLISQLESHRDNYSRGTGNYISDHGWDGAGSGWRFDTVKLPLSPTTMYYSPCEDGLPPLVLPTPRVGRTL
jgi:hypothetical protein